MTHPEPQSDASSNPDNKAAPQNVKKSLFSGKALLLLVAVVCALALAGLLWWLHASQFEQTDDASLSGHVHPVSARITGNIIRVLVEDNQQVKPGQLLAIIDPREADIALSQAEHNLINARAQAKTASKNIVFAQKQAASQLTQAQGGVGTSVSTIGQSRQSVAEAAAGVKQAEQTVRQEEVSYQKALSDYHRYQAVNPDAISAQQLNTVLAQLRSSEASRNSAKAALLQSQARLSQAKTGVKSNVSRLLQSRGALQGAQAQESQVEVVRSQYESARSAIAVAEDAVRQARLNVSYTKIVAPLGGRVGRKTVEVGQRVQIGEPLMALVSSDVWVVANYKETQLERMRRGQPVNIHVDAFPNHDFKGCVESFSPASGSQFALLPPENATGNFTKIVQRVPVKIRIEAESLRGFEDLLLPGISTVTEVQVSKGSRCEPTETAQSVTRKVTRQVTRPITSSGPAPHD